MKMQDPTIYPLSFDKNGNLVQLVGMSQVTVMESRTHMKFKDGLTVRLAEYYLSDEASPDCASELAVIIQQPKDSEELVGIEYNNGSIDFVPQDILEII